MQEESAYAFTIPEFCKAHRIGRATYYRLPIRPREIKIGPRKKIITDEAAAEWRRKMQALSDSADDSAESE